MVKMKFNNGAPETFCGGGSTLAATAALRTVLPPLLGRLAVVTLLDAPCGDLNWIARTDLSAVHYIGADFDPEHCAAARARDFNPPAFAPRTRQILERDLIRDTLPAAELILCRDFLQHLPTEQALAALGNLANASTRYLLVTSHDNAVNTDIDQAGDFRPLNLFAPPFNCAAPLRTITDGTGRILALLAV